MLTSDYRGIYEEFHTEFHSTNEKFETGFQEVGSSLRGDSAYEVAVDNGFYGTEKEWLESLKGKDGADGKDGYTPVKGIDYFDGEKGDKGDKGEQGVQGEKGADGKDGKDGHTPIRGVDYFTDADKQAMISELQALQKSETWTFTLDDGSTVEKQVLVK